MSHMYHEAKYVVESCDTWWYMYLYCEIILVNYLFCLFRHDPRPDFEHQILA
jgi:hypothetical protein